MAQKLCVQTLRLETVEPEVAPAAAEAVLAVPAILAEPGGVAAGRKLKKHQKQGMIA
jgi:hypothetical protein